jgi:hypothetical protein
MALPLKFKASLQGRMAAEVAARERASAEDLEHCKAALQLQCDRELALAESLVRPRLLLSTCKTELW